MEIIQFWRAYFSKGLKPPTSSCDISYVESWARGRFSSNFFGKGELLFWAGIIKWSVLGWPKMVKQKHYFIFEINIVQSSNLESSHNSVHVCSFGCCKRAIDVVCFAQQVVKSLLLASQVLVVWVSPFFSNKKYSQSRLYQPGIGCSTYPSQKSRS